LWYTSLPLEHTIHLIVLPILADCNKKGYGYVINGLATQSALQMLPASALRIKKSDGLSDEGGQLWTFTAVYCVDVCCTKSPILTMYPLLTGNHVPDKNICIPPDIFIGP